MIDTSDLNPQAQPAALELREALVAYKKSSGRMFPTCSEVLEVIRELGYVQPASEIETTATAEESSDESVEAAASMREPETVIV